MSNPELEEFIKEIEGITSKYPNLHICIWRHKEEMNEIRIDINWIHFPPPRQKEEAPIAQW